MDAVQLFITGPSVGYNFDPQNITLVESQSMIVLNLEIAFYCSLFSNEVNYIMCYNYYNN